MQVKRFGRQVREWRRVRGLSLEQTAALVGTTGATLSRLERGLHRPRRKLAMRLSELLGEQPVLPIEWHREPKLDGAAREFLAQAARRNVRVPSDVEDLTVWRAGDGAFLILRVGGVTE
ncbi:MAG: helix-turn-helix transcriptional regulator [Armatimonadota bacterium]|nr:MAG: helix-turn-helix transcriptional regulator [Armatimonadota bacterium]